MAEVVIENPVLNSPYGEPGRHFRFDEEGITDEVVEERRKSIYFMPIAQPKKKGKQLQLDTEWTRDRIEENVFINRVRERVGLWRRGGYQGVTRTTRGLLEYWQNPDSFDPDRWLPERRQANKGAYVPFGFSSRACIGSAVGHAQLLLFCALVTRDFELTVQDEPTPWMQLEGFAIPVDFIGTLTPRHA